ncbi:MAG: NAD(P)/FAD-dependent oxidoreductase [Acidobacteria bacterium]|nr:NAD(P)/FAD-dependent oxidoreductase [Acidobacteriota bacterium]
MQSTIVVLGGGVGGMVAANGIRRQLPAAHRVVVVEKNSQHAFAPSFLWLMTGDRKPDQIRRPLAGLLRRGVELVQAEVIGIDPVHRKVRTSAAEIAYDYLIVALGADLAPDASRDSLLRIPSSLSKALPLFAMLSPRSPAGASPSSYRRCRTSVPELHTKGPC